jgi:3-deoxy-D-manno-octulosonic-acid transferase
MSLAVYRLATQLMSPLIDLYLNRRVARGKEDPARLRERYGVPSHPRPMGPLVWIHAASVGEATSVLPLIERLLDDDERRHVLITTGTVTSARLMAARLPRRAFHQYVPVDRPAAVRAFIDHWHPSLAIWVESELWPNLIGETRRRGTPMVLLNGRLSDRSFRRWQRLGRTATRLMQSFDLCLAQTPPDAGRFATLGAHTVACVGNLKSAAPPLPADEKDVARLRQAIAGRPHWLAASTHAGEEATCGRVHRRLAAGHPDLLTIVGPRHPERGPGVAAELRGLDLAVTRRAGLEPLRRDTEVYVADTLGELGLFYRLGAPVFVGGSLVPHGGQNPLEAARLGNPVLLGPHTDNFTEINERLVAAGGAEVVADEAALAGAVDRLLRDPAERARRGEAASAVAATGAGVLDAVLAELDPFLAAPRAAA